MNAPRDLERFIASIPKVELHVHLEGAMRPALLLELARRRGVSLPATDETGLQEFFRFRDFEHFVEVYVLCSKCLRDPEDFQLLVEDFLAGQERQNVRYTEAHLTISTHLANGGNGGEIADAVRQSIRRVEKERGIGLRLIADIVRNVPYERADQTVEWALEHREGLVVALGMSGKEDFPCEPFRSHFEAAAEEGLGRVAHAGEQTTAADIRKVLEVCRPQRIGHGIRAVEDLELVDELVERRLPLEVNLTSNVRLGNAESYDSHPLGTLYRRGVPVSINTDDPAFFDTTLVAEYEHAASLLGLGARDVAELARAAMRHSFLPSAEKEALEAGLERQTESAAEEG